MPKNARYFIGILSVIGILSGCAGTAAPKPAGNAGPGAGTTTGAGGANGTSPQRTAINSANDAADRVTSQGKKAIPPNTRYNSGALTNQAGSTATRTKRTAGDYLAGLFGRGPTSGTPKKTTPLATAVTPNKAAGPVAPGTGSAPAKKGPWIKGKAVAPAKKSTRLIKDVIVFVDPTASTSGAKSTSATGATGHKDLVSLGTHASAATIVSPLWFGVKADGSIVSHVDSATAAFAKTHHLKLMPLVRNSGGNNAFLMNTTARDNAVKNITALVKKNGYPGINIDFELLKPPARVPLEQFMDELSHNLRPSGKLVTVDIIPTASQIGAHGAYNEVSLARYADALILMAYDHHSDSSAPGPVSPHGWVVAAVKHTLQSGVAPSKIILGVNDYGYDWVIGGKGSTISEKAATALRGAHSFDKSFREYHVAYTDASGHKHVVWFGGPSTLGDRVAMVKKYKLRGLAIWRAGYENASYWKNLKSASGK